MKKKNSSRFHSKKYFAINYESIPLHGALDVVAASTASIICVSVLKKKCQQSDLYQDMSPCVRCQDFDVLPDEVVRKMDVILLCLQNPNDIENIICRIKDVLYILERLTPCRMSEKIHTLSLLLKEIVKRLVCSVQGLEESFDNTQTKMTLNLVNNFIRDWSEKRSKSYPSLRICRFCDRAITETTRQWGTFCCEEAFKFNNIRIEWVLRQSISDSSKKTGDTGPWKDPRSLREEEQFLDTEEEGVRYSAGTEEEASDKRGRRGPRATANLPLRIDSEGEKKKVTYKLNKEEIEELKKKKKVEIKEDEKILTEDEKSIIELVKKEREKEIDFIRVKEYVKPIEFPYKKVVKVYEKPIEETTIKYQLSNPLFVKLGWTMLPVSKIMRKVIEYQTNPAKPHLDWFKKYRLERRLYYNDKRIFMNFSGARSAEIYYPNGSLAIKFSRPPEREYDMYTVFSPGGKDFMGVKRRPQIIAVFDTMGNGAVFDEEGRTRVSFNQIGGVWKDNPTRIPLTWRWDIFERTPILENVYVEKSAAHLEKYFYPPTMKVFRSNKASTPSLVSRKEKRVEYVKPVFEEEYEEEEEEEEKVQEVESEQIYSSDACYLKPIFVQMNDYISLKILNRRTVTLRFLANTKNVRIELGTILNLTKQVGFYFVDMRVKFSLLKCKFDDPIHIRPDSSVYNIYKELEKIKKMAKQRELMMEKYRPYLHTWKMMGTRCRPR
ncbi:uncharacterized protein LOC122714192 [Apis laboriosa]|uniref:uncharacterized protein LOC122714192 n=1 Tax=Apis laboriosa TaxID=183418 RepID=UPI001CC69270|nr:uncharacterized protein LOC122714192 [Apis laboriosa]